jgi:hypothetical protein
MPYFIAVHRDHHTALWFIEGATARRADGAQEQVDVPLGSDAMLAVTSTRPQWEFHPLTLRPGEYYKRMARPNSAYPHQSPGTNPGNNSERVLIETIRGQLTALRSQLENIFRTVHPVKQNFGAFGHEIRNLLILAATEAESHWKGVLKANDVRGSSTHDYAKLANAMKLGEYSIRLPFYPWLEPIAPFRGWGPSERPTKDLLWYDAYNAVKHDRENAFDRATLVNALTAVCGCAVMTFAQFGTSGFHYRVEINSFFEIETAPEWHPSEVYCAHTDGQPWTPIPYPF